MTGHIRRENYNIDVDALCYHLIRNFTGLPGCSVKYERE